MTKIGIICTQLLQEEEIFLNNDTQMLKNLSENLGAKFPAATRGYSMTKIACLNDTFSEVFEQEASPVEDQSLQQKIRKG